MAWKDHGLSKSLRLALNSKLADEKASLPGMRYGKKNGDSAANGETLGGGVVNSLNLLAAKKKKAKKSGKAKAATNPVAKT